MSTAPPKVDLTPLALTVRPCARLAQLLGGLVLYGASMALMVRAQLGLAPWGVLHQGLAQRWDWSFGAVTALTGATVLVLWLPLRQRPGIGTVANVAVIAVSVDVVLHVVPPASDFALQAPLLVAGVLLNGIATATYVGTRLGPGPRDGLMTGLHARTGWSIRLVRTGIEATVLLAGWLLGGGVGPGTALYAFAIGPVTQRALPAVAVRTARDG